MIPTSCSNGIRLVFMQFLDHIISAHLSFEPHPTRVAASSLQFKRTPNLKQRILKTFAVAIMVVFYGVFTTASAKNLEAEMGGENSRRLAVYTKRDAHAFATIYTADAVILPQGGPSIKGRTAIVQYWDKMLSNGFQNPALEMIDWYKEGKMAYQTCRRSILKIQDDGSAKSLTGNTLRIFERQRDGRWLIKVHMSNTDQPIP
ncbi:SgcJ/EcaC family oxidoreductase [Noviherbaspirillum sp. 1P10PC]|uniref:YybH family protein n=1 Tax=Noviherbaspirillum sp. 1P10PC TaxID=3132292 RepID=UPI0039A28891